MGVNTAARPMKPAGCTAAVLLLAAGARASLVTSPGAVGATDTVAWGSIGPNNSPVSDPFDAQINPDLSVVVSTTNSGSFYLSTQGNGWKGNFPAGDSILWNHDLGAVTFQFSSPVGGMGLYVQNDNYGTFTASFYDATGNLLGREIGTADGNNDGSAPFIGIVDAAADISTVVVGTDVSQLGGPNGDSNNFAFDTLEVNATGSPVPEPAAGLFAAGAVSLSCRRRRYDR
jgi:hypothetical protein